MPPCDVHAETIAAASRTKNVKAKAVAEMIEPRARRLPNDLCPPPLGIMDVSCASCLQVSARPVPLLSNPIHFNSKP